MELTQWRCEERRGSTRKRYGACQYCPYATPPRSLSPHLIRGGLESLALEYVTQVSTAALAGDLDPLHAECTVDMSVDGTRDRIEEGGPATAGLELGTSLVQGAVAASAVVDACRWVVSVILACPCHLGSLLTQDAELHKSAHFVQIRCQRLWTFIVESECSLQCQPLTCSGLS